MISQLLSTAKPPSILDLGTAASVENGDSGKAGGFSSLLTVLGAHSAGANEGAIPAEKAAAADSAPPTATGKPDPSLAATGKILPPALPVLATPASPEDMVAASPLSEDAEASEPGEVKASAPDGEASAIPAEAIQIAAFVVAGRSASQPTPAVAEGSAAGPATAQAAARTLAAANGRASVPAAPTRGEPASAASVALQVAPQSASAEQQAAPRDAIAAKGGQLPAERLAANTGDRSAQRDFSGEQRPSPELTAKAAVKVVAEPAQFAATPAAPVVAPGSIEPVTDGVRPFAAERPGLEAQITRELSRIVDSLSAAREALTAKSATLAFDHADFGELSLRFDQRRDGQLAVQLSAANPDSHRAVAAAVAERPAFAQSDASANAQQQQGGTNSNASARGAAGEREGNAAGNDPARQERSERQRAREARADDTGRGAARRSGVFA